MLPSKSRLKGAHKTQTLLKEGRLFSTRAFHFRVLSSQNPPSVFAIITSRRLSKKAVERNRLRRRLRALIQRHLLALDPPMQVAMIPRAATLKMPFVALEAEILNLARRLSSTPTHA